MPERNKRCLKDRGAFIIPVRAGKSIVNGLLVNSGSYFVLAGLTGIDKVHYGFYYEVMNYEINPSILYYESPVFTLLYEVLTELDCDVPDAIAFFYGNYTLRIYEGGIQSASAKARNFFHGNHTFHNKKSSIKSASIPVPSIMKELLDGDYNWQHIYKLIPELPKTATGKYTGKVEFHTNEGGLAKIKFIPKIKP